MTTIIRRIEKLESALLSEKDIDYTNMTPEQRRHRIAELIYLGLCDTDPEVKNMTEQDFLSMYLAMDPTEREAMYDRPIYEQLTGTALI